MFGAELLEMSHILQKRLSADFKAVNKPESVDGKARTFKSAKLLNKSSKLDRDYWNPAYFCPIEGYLFVQEKTDASKGYTTMQGIRSSGNNLYL